MKSSCRIELFGELRVRNGTQVLDRFATRKISGLLAFLALSMPQSSPRESLIEQFWPDYDTLAGRNSLNVALSGLRRSLEILGPPVESLLLADRYLIRLNPALVETDVQQFDTLIDSARSAEIAFRQDLLIQATGLYRGELLPGYYEEWAVREQERLHTRYVEALQQIALGYETLQQRDAAIDAAQKALQADPYAEEMVRCLMRLFVASGRPNFAIDTYRALEQRLHDEMDAVPDAVTQKYIEQIRQEMRPVQPPVVATIVTPSPHAKIPVLAATIPTVISVPPITVPYETVGGGVQPNSYFYIRRRVDERFMNALAQQESVILIEGARQIGKTSMLARGLQMARESGKTVIYTDLESFSSRHLISSNTFFVALATLLANRLGVEDPRARWDSDLGASLNMDTFIERVLHKDTAPVIWGLDEADRLFGLDFTSEVFGLFRSWHNRRALEPDSAWHRLTLAIAYATESRLFIPDLSQSPFNIGTHLVVDDFTLEQVAELNRRYGVPISTEDDLQTLYTLVGGHPYLVRRALEEMTRNPVPLSDIIHRATQDDGPFGTHLRRLYASLMKDAELAQVMRDILQGLPCLKPESFYRLYSAGLVGGNSFEEARPRNQLYAEYLKPRLR